MSLHEVPWTCMQFHALTYSSISLYVCRYFLCLSSSHAFCSVAVHLLSGWLLVLLDSSSRFHGQDYLDGDMLDTHLWGSFTYPIPLPSRVHYQTPNPIHDHVICVRSRSPYMYSPINRICVISVSKSQLVNYSDCITKDVYRCPKHSYQDDSLSS